MHSPFKHCRADAYVRVSIIIKAYTKLAGMEVIGSIGIAARSNMHATESTIVWIAARPLVAPPPHSRSKSACCHIPAHVHHLQSVQV